MLSIAKRTRTPFDEILIKTAEKPIGWLLLLAGVLIALHIVGLHADANSIVKGFINVVDHAGRAISILLGCWFVWLFINGIAEYLDEHVSQTSSTLDDQLLPFITKILKAFVVVTAILVVAQNLGYSISGLIASLGIGGIAIALAAKETIANLFGSIMILLDRPFAVGDWIKTNEFEGVVEDIGFRSTSIRTFAKTLVNVPNALLANMVVNNIDAMPKRRIKTRIGITYETSTTQVNAALDGIRKILEQHQGVNQEYILVNFDEFHDSSLSIFLYYFSASTVWEEYLNVRQDVNLQIMQLLEQLGIELAFPTQTIHVEK
ncbi:MAG: mechanosensitive ion channel family protein [Mariprofundales bacterium]